VDVHRKRILDVLRIDVGAEFVVDQLDHLVERVTLGRPDVVDALQFVIGCELAGANDVVDVREVPCLAPVAEQFRAVTVGDLVGELGDRVGELAFMFFGAAEALIHREEAQAGKSHAVEVVEVLCVALTCELGGLIARSGFDGHTLGRGFSSVTVDRGGRRVDDGLTAVFASLFDRVHESLDIDAGTFGGIFLVHLVRGERREVEHDVDVCGEVLVDNGFVNELDLIGEVLGSAKVAVVDGDHVVVGGEVVRDVRPDEAGAARDENAFVLHERFC